MRLENAASQFLKACAVEKRLGANTIEAYKRDLEQFRRYTGGGRVQTVLTLEVVKGFLAFMLEERGLSVATAKRRIACLQAFGAYLDATDVMANPLVQWSPKLRRPKRLPRSLTGPELDALVHAGSASDSTDQETLFCVLLISATGLRVSELCAIRASDVSADGRQIHVLGKGLRDRLVYVGNARLAAALAKRKLAIPVMRGANPHLFLNSRGGALKPQTLRRRLHKLQTELGFSRPVTPHMLRHTAATRLIERGIDIRFVQRLLGHASIATTEIYTHVSDTALRDAISRADAVGDLVGRLSD